MSMAAMRIMWVREANTTGDAGSAIIIRSTVLILLSCPDPSSLTTCFARASTRFTRMLQGVEDGDVHALHRTRVASRRLREVLPVLQLDPDVTQQAQPPAEENHRPARRGARVRRAAGCCGRAERRGALPEGGAGARRRPTSATTGSMRGSASSQKVPIGELRRVAAKLDKAGRTLEKDGAPPPQRRDRAPLVAVGHRRARRAPRVGARRRDGRRWCGVSRRAPPRGAHRGQEAAIRPRIWPSRRRTSSRAPISGNCAACRTSSDGCTIFRC